MVLDREQIKEILPHREPFLFVDEVESISVEEGKITAIKHVREDEYYFEGHFPQEKVMPGVLIAESLAQAGAVAILSMDKFKGKTPYFTGIKSARFPHRVVPGDDLRLEAELTKLGSRAGHAKCKAVIADSGKTACECEISFIIG